MSCWWMMTTGHVSQKTNEQTKVIQELVSPEVSIQLMDCVIKWGNRFINSTRNYFRGRRQLITFRPNNGQLTASGEEGGSGCP